MYVLVLASQKGGSGKTTLSGHLAVEAERAGLGPVALIDTDPQGSLSDWWNARKAETPHFARLALAQLDEALQHLDRSGVKLAVIDTPPAITDSISQVVAHADLVLIPTRPSPHDLRAVGATVEIAEHHNKPLVFVVNAATARARITGETAVALSQHGTVAPVTVHHRVDFAASMVDGRTVGEVVPKSASTKEIRDLWAYVQDRLSRIVKDPELASRENAPAFAVQALSGLGAPAPAPEPEPEVEEYEYDLREEVLAEPAPPVSASPSDDTIGMTLDEKHSSPQRRGHLPGVRPFGTSERRGHPFGRRLSDRPFQSGSGEK
ncbi:MAG TPA: ParA family protein [Rhizomicrobium sp.]|nr:ParA family protein [Rhizomicrobium sp.]